jgi:predicted MFS family arabinose efflux permease
MLGGFATGLPTLVLSRIVAGLFGGPATSLTSAIVADTIPPERRGWAFGIVMGGFAVASVLGVPAGLALAQLGGWRAPFFGVAGVIVLAIVAAMRLLPSLGAHLAAAKDASRDGLSASLFELLRKPVVRSSLALTAVTMMSSFVVIPTIPAYVQYNLELPPERLGLLYLFGGIASFLSTRLAGPLVDRLGAFRVSLAAAVGVSFVLWALFVRLAPVPVLVLTTAFFVVMGARGVAYNALTSMVPDAHERARFQSVQSAVQHGASSAAAFVAAQLLVELPGHKLGHVDRVGICAIALSLAVPISVAFVERAIARRREATV